ncbi:hypothetical protein [Olleya namhaensis]|uniref:Lipoprotein n=1 Tax=Olleya namhaensis TaxID=1144750 RepID=A0A1I3SBW1_9FLAO|nr:hypothetical protein [Olleya namhaensis]SFJ56284.1 hypothetical protein SAMN05443431_1105 [Olleya namhaensis]
MKIIILISSFCFLLLGCKSTYQKKCQETALSPPISINSYEELINYGDNLNRKLDLIIMDGILVDEFLLKKFIFNNPNYYLVYFINLADVNTKILDGPPNRILILKSNLCGKLIKRKGQYIIQE